VGEKHFNFFGLPPELRNYIYRELSCDLRSCGVTKPFVD